MKALVLAGGSDSRLLPITHTSTKQLLPVASEPVLCYGLEVLRDAGIRAAGIIVGDTAPAIQAAVGMAVRSTWMSPTSGRRRRWGSPTQC